MNEIEEKLNNIVENLGYEMIDVEEIDNDDEIQNLIDQLDEEEIEISGPIDKFYRVTTEEGITCKIPVIYDEIEEGSILKEEDDEIDFENEFDEEDLADPDNPLSDDF